MKRKATAAAMIGGVAITILGDEGVHKPHVCGHADLVSTSHSFALWAEHAESYWSLQSALSEQSKRYGYHVFWYHGGSAATAATAAMRREICMQIPGPLVF